MNTQKFPFAVLGSTSIAASIAALMVACATGAPVSTPDRGTAPVQTPAQIVTPVVTSAPATGALATATAALLQTPATVSLPPAGTTTFHLEITGGPKAGTYDVASTGPADCAYLPNLNKWTAVFLGPPPLTFIQADTSEDLPSLLVSFDRDLPTFVSIRSIGDVTHQVDDRGQSATLTIASEDNEADFADGSPSQEFGPVELTVECGAPFRY